MSLTQINKAGLDEIALDHVFTIGASGSSAYTFQGEGLNGTVNNPTLYLTRGKTYRFENGSGGHPIRIQSTSGASGTAYNTGVTNNAGSGTVIVEVQHDAPDVLYYQCTSHAAMNGILYITGALADGGVTTAKIADDAVTDAKLANSINAAIAANTAKTTNATHTGDVTGSTSLTIADSAVTTAKIANNAINSDKIATNAVNTTEIADTAVTLAKLEHGTSSNDGKFLRANNGADPTFETVNTDLVADTSPQLGGNLDTNSFEINLDDNHSVNFGDSTDLNIKHTGVYGVLQNTTGGFFLQGENAVTIKANNNVEILKATGDENMAKFIPDGAVELYHDNTKVFETGANRIFAKARFNINADGIGSGHDLGFGQWDGSNHRIEGDSNRPMFITSYHSSGIKFGASSAVKATVTSNGLTFNGDTAAANALDDYEEGQYNPTMTSGCTLYSNEDTLMYTKIGRMVYVTGRIRINSDSYSGGLTMSLPFTAASSTDCSNCGHTYVATHGVHFDLNSDSNYSGTDLGHLSLETGSNTAISYFIIPHENAGWVGADSHHIDSNSYLTINHFYYT